MREFVIWLSLVSCPAAIFAFFGTAGLDAFKDGPEAGAPVAVMQQGRTAFARECARCHGRVAQGTRRAPSLDGQGFGRRAISDGAIREAVLRGTDSDPAFAPMAPRSVAPADLDSIIRFLREIQRIQGAR